MSGTANTREDSQNRSPISDSLRERISEDVGRMVLWGEAKENVVRKLEVNGITGSDAEAIYNRAFSERIAVIHGFYRGKARKGMLWMAGGIVLLALCYFVLHIIHSTIWIGIVVLLGFGLWKFVDGFTGMLFAKKYEGSVADLES